MTGKKQTTLNLTTSLMAFVINAGINFLLTPYLIEKLGTESYGFIGLANDIVNYANILSMALNAMSSRFVSVEYHKGNKEKAEVYINSVIIANLLLAGAVAFASIFVVWKLEYLINIPENLMFDVKVTFALVFVNYLISIIIAILNCAPFIKNRMNLVYTRNMISYIIKLIVTILLITLFDIKVYFISLTTLICTIYLAVANSIIFNKLLPEMVLSYKKFSWKAVKEILSSGIWMSLLTLSNMLLSGLNSLLTNRFVSVIATGYLSVAKSIPNYISSLGTQLGTVFAPKFTEKYAKGDIKGLISDAKKSISIMSFIIAVPVAGFIAFGRNFYTLWVHNYTSAEIDKIQIVSIIVTLPTLFNALVYPLIQINTACNRVRVPVLVTFAIGIANVLVVFPLGFMGKLNLELLTISTSLLMSARYVIFQPIYAAHILRIKKGTFYMPIIKNTLVFVLLLLVFDIFKSLFVAKSWFSFIIIIGCAALIGYGISFFTIFNRSERAEVLSTFKLKAKLKK